MKYTLSDIARILDASGKIIRDIPVENLLLDSRKVFAPAHSLFFALTGDRRDGHQFIPELYKRGVRSFIVSRVPDTGLYPEASFLQVQDTLGALQELAAHHRRQFTIPVIGITGSNGKTIVKEWLYQLLQEDYQVVRSPKSYNSQIGVPLSVWQMQEQHTLAIFEAGISKPGEMARLEYIIRPTIGILTNIGEAHSEGFSSPAEKEKEKRLLFRNAVLPATLELLSVKKENAETILEAKGPGMPEGSGSIRIPFTDDASVQNAVHCWQTLLHLGYKQEIIAQRMKNLQPVNMRLELKKGINHCVVINDSYSADLSSLEIALNFLDQQSTGRGKTVILSDFHQSALPDDTLYTQVLESLEKHKVSRLIAIGERITTSLRKTRPQTGGPLRTELFDSTASFIQQFRSSHFREETLLVKGARSFAFEQVVQLLEQKVHQTLLEINLDALAHNLRVYRKQLHPGTKIMAMVKAFAYGSGGSEIAGTLQYHGVDYLGVAYADEGVELRKAGISLPIMVMNPEPNAFDAITEHNLEPEIYSFGLLQAFDQYLQREGMEQYPVHIEIETGMNRLGFDATDMTRLAETLQATVSLKVVSVFSHLAASEDPGQDAFTKEQFNLFAGAVKELEGRLGYSFLRHISNTAALSRHPSLQLDMVRLGIGLYGVDTAAAMNTELETVATLKSTIAQLKRVKKGGAVSYGRNGKVDRDSVIATVRIGYADGFPRRLGNGKGKVWVAGKLAPVLGTVCMDMFMVDVTDIPGVQEGDDVVIFGRELPVQQLADWAGTIPYEIMTGVSQRVKRVYYEQ